jgi:uncharacterized protein
MPFKLPTGTKLFSHMSSKVYFTDFRTTTSVSLLKKLEKLLAMAGIDKLDCKDKFTAIKIHFGEPGNMAYLRPNYVNVVVGILRKMGAKVFLTDSNTLYSGGRANAVNHIDAAMKNGFNPIAVDAPVIIADGLKGTDFKEMPVIGGEICEYAKIGSAVADADVIVSLTHFKGHEMTGFGGTLKNLGMGAASVGGKLFLHSEAQPKIQIENCRGCHICEKSCAHDAIHVNNNHKAEIDYTKCVGCGQCVAVCQFDAAQVVHNSSSKMINYKIAEYTKAILQNKPNFHISFIMNVSPECDCWGSNDAAIVPDIGIAASYDPVALDMACADLVMKAPAIDGTLLTDNIHADHNHSNCHNSNCQGDNDKFFYLHPNTDWKSCLEHAEKIKLGTVDYELVKM